MSSSIHLIKALRKKTDAAIKDCSKALSKSNNNMEEAEEILRLQGMYSAKKRSSKPTKEGVVTMFSSGSRAVLIELCAETDFVCKNQKFLELADLLAKAAYAFNCENTEDFLKNTSIEGVKTKDFIDQHIATIGENIILKKIKTISVTPGHLHSYIHGKINANSGSIISVIGFKGAELDGTAQLARQIAMHVVASKPLALNVSDLCSSIVSKEKRVLRAQVEQEGKPSSIADKIIEGRLNKFYENVVLMEQVFVLDNKTKIKTLNSEIKDKYQNSLDNFIRLAVGEDSDE